MTADAHIMIGLSRIGMLLRSEGWRQAEATGLTPTQAQILAHLAARGPARIGMIATEIAVTQPTARSEEHPSELQSLMRTSSAAFCLKQKSKHQNNTLHNPNNKSQ